MDISSKAPQLAYASSSIPTQKTVELDAGDKHMELDAGDKYMELDSRTFVELQSGKEGQAGSGRV